jgi:hypothetical protein
MSRTGVCFLQKLLRNQPHAGGEIRKRSLRRKAFWQLAAKSAFALLLAKVTKINPAPKRPGRGFTQIREKKCHFPYLSINVLL